MGLRQAFKAIESSVDTQNQKDILLFSCSKESKVHAYIIGLFSLIIENGEYIEIVNLTGSNYNIIKELNNSTISVYLKNNFNTGTKITEKLEVSYGTIEKFIENTEPKTGDWKTINANSKESLTTEFITNSVKLDSIYVNNIQANGNDYIIAFDSDLNGNSHNITNINSYNGLSIDTNNTFELRGNEKNVLINSNLTIGSNETNTGAVTIKSAGSNNTIIIGPDNDTTTLVKGTYTTSATTANDTNAVNNTLVKRDGSAGIKAAKVECTNIDAGSGEIKTTGTISGESVVVRTLTGKTTKDNEDNDVINNIILGANISGNHKTIGNIDAYNGLSLSIKINSNDTPVGFEVKGADKALTIYSNATINYPTVITKFNDDYRGMIQISTGTTKDENQNDVVHTTKIIGPDNDTTILKAGTVVVESDYSETENGKIVKRNSSGGFTAGNIVCTGLNAQSGNITTTGTISGGAITGTSFTETSDRRLKKDIVDSVFDYIDLVKKIQLKEFKFIDGDDSLKLGVIAQELRDILPEKYKEVFISGSENEGDHLSVNVTKLTYVALGALQEEIKKRKALEERISKLEKLLIERGII